MIPHSDQGTVILLKCSECLLMKVFANENYHMGKWSP